MYIKFLFMFFDHLLISALSCLLQNSFFSSVSDFRSQQSMESTNSSVDSYSVDYLDHYFSTFDSSGDGDGEEDDFTVSRQNSNKSNEHAGDTSSSDDDNDENDEETMEMIKKEEQVNASLHYGWRRELREV